MSDPKCITCDDTKVMQPTFGAAVECPECTAPVDAYAKLSEEHIGQFFRFTHLPPHLAEVSSVFADVAVLIIATLPRNPERTVALRKLLESKDAAVRARLAKTSGFLP